MWGDVTSLVHATSDIWMSECDKCVGWQWSRVSVFNGHPCKMPQVLQENAQNLAVHHMGKGRGLLCTYSGHDTGPEYEL